MKREQKNRQKFGSSIGFKIILLVAVSLILTFSVIIVAIIPSAKQSIQTAIENNMLDLSEDYSGIVDDAVSKSADGTLTTDELTTLLSTVGIRGYDSSYCYLCDTDGTFLYHNREEKIGTVVLNDQILQLLDEIPTGNYEKSGVFHYTDENGLEKYASYCVSDQNHWVLVVLASESDIMETINSVRNRASFIGILLLIGASIITVIFSRNIVRPIKELTQIIEKTARLDFSEDNRLEKLVHRKDETGSMCRASVEMQKSLQSIVHKMEHLSAGMNQNSANLKEISIVINDASDSNSATSQELAAYMEETSATTENIEINVDAIYSSTTEISEMSRDGVQVTESLMGRAEEMNETSENTRNRVLHMSEDVRQKTQTSIEKSKAVEKINVLTNTIMSIAEQTSLLALNASIEAARAGEQGKGFAVVAGEIGSLANQSSDAVQSIVEIVKEVQDAVGDMAGCLQMTGDFINNDIIPDYETFLEGSRMYKDDAGSVKESMANISEKITQLQKSSQEIATAISDINKTIGEEAQGITDIAQKTTDVVNSAHEVREIVDITAGFATELKDMVEEFTL